MSKRTDPAERRRLLTDALFRVIAREGLESVSIRQVAAEAGATSGMVQHYFPSKDAMMEHAMLAARAAYERHLTERLEELGEDPAPRELLTAMLGGLLSTDDLDAARVAFAFQAYAARRPEAAARLARDSAELREHLAAILVGAGLGGDRAPSTATALIATAEGLGVQVISENLPLEAAHQALATHIALVMDPLPGRA